MLYNNLIFTVSYLNTSTRLAVNDHTTSPSYPQPVFFLYTEIFTISFPESLYGEVVFGLQESFIPCPEMGDLGEGGGAN